VCDAESATRTTDSEPPTPQPAPPADGGALASGLEELGLASATLARGVARNLIRRIDQVERALAREDLERAIDRARDLDDRIDGAVSDGRVTGDDARRLQDASRALLDALEAARP
jgi:hypothetical protein